MKRKTTLYCQCSLEKTIETGVVKQVAFIPKKFAKLNDTIKIKKDDGWDHGWVVKSVGTELAEENLPDSHKGIKQHKKRTGDVST